MRMASFKLMDTEMHKVGPGIEVPVRTTFCYPDQENLEAHLKEIKERGDTDSLGFMLGSTVYNMDEILEFLSETLLISEEGEEEPLKEIFLTIIY